MTNDSPDTKSKQTPNTAPQNNQADSDQVDNDQIDNKQTHNNQSPAQPKKTTEQKSDAPNSQTPTATPNLVAEPKTTNVSAEVAETPKPQMKKVDIFIAGVTYQIYCPINEEEELRSAVYYLNNFVLDIKKSAPNLPQENLLVLCCLNLYEKIHTQTKTDEIHRQKTEQSVALLNKILQDAQSIV